MIKINSISGKSLINETEKTGETRSIKGKKFKSFYDASSDKKKALKQEKKSPLMTPFELMHKIPDFFSASENAAVVQATSEINALFEEMISSMISLNNNGITETTFYLNSTDSVFSGTQVTIREFSTAPKTFNIELMGTPQAVDAFQKYLGELVAAFNAEAHRPFKINRLETHHLNSKKRSFAQNIESHSEERVEDDRNNAVSLG